MTWSSVSFAGAVLASGARIALHPVAKRQTRAARAGQRGFRHGIARIHPPLVPARQGASVQFAPCRPRRREARRKRFVRAPPSRRQIDIVSTSEKPAAIRAVILPMSPPERGIKPRAGSPPPAPSRKTGARAGTAADRADGQRTPRPQPPSRAPPRQKMRKQAQRRKGLGLRQKGGLRAHHPIEDGGKVKGALARVHGLGRLLRHPNTVGKPLRRGARQDRPPPKSAQLMCRHPARTSYRASASAARFRESFSATTPSAPSRLLRRPGPPEYHSVRPGA